MTGPYVIGCDVGSQGTNAALYGVDGTLVASAYETHDLAFPHPTWAEQDPEDWVRALHRAIPSLLKRGPGGAVRREGRVLRVRSSTAWSCATARGGPFGRR